jgi:4a-hydroxytetrahydrobiopterin dehydratase
MEKFSQMPKNWLEKDNYLQKNYEFNNFLESIDFINQVANIAEKLNHHPIITINYNKVEIKTTTHDEGDIITKKDYQLSQEIDKIF